MKTLTIIGRRWFQKTYGNTYFTADIIVDGELIHTLPFQYGYEDHYLDVANDWLSDHGYLDNPRSESTGSRQPLWQKARDEMGVKFHYSATDVQRKKDL